MPYDIKLRRSFAAAHAIRLYDGSLEPVHGHNWDVTVTVSAEQLDSIGVVMDFHELQRRLDEIIRPWSNRHLNEVEPFETPGGGLNPTAEHVAMVVAGRVAKTLAPPLKVMRVEVVEASDCVAVWRA